MSFKFYILIFAKRTLNLFIPELPFARLAHRPKMLMRVPLMVLWDENEIECIILVSFEWHWQRRFTNASLSVEDHSYGSCYDLCHWLRCTSVESLRWSHSGVQSLNSFSRLILTNRKKRSVVKATANWQARALKCIVIHTGSLRYISVHVRQRPFLEFTNQINWEISFCHLICLRPSTDKRPLPNRARVH